MNSDIKVTIVTPQEWEMYKQIRLETLKEEPQAFGSKYEDAVLFEDSYWKKLLSDPQSIYVFAKDQQKVIGVMRVTFDDKDEPENTAIIGGAYVNKNYRGQKIGEKMLNTLLNISLAKHNIVTIRLYVKPSQVSAISLYKSVGFSQTGVKEGEIIMERLNNKEL